MNLTPSDLQFRTWLMAQPDDRVFSTDTFNCPLTCFGREVLGFKESDAAFDLVFDKARYDGDHTDILSARAAVFKMIALYDDYLGKVTAKQFRQLYEEGLI